MALQPKSRATAKEIDEWLKAEHASDGKKKGRRAKLYVGFPNAPDLLDVPHDADVPPEIRARLHDWHDAARPAFEAMRSLTVAVNVYMNAQTRARWARVAPANKHGAGRRREAPKAVERAVDGLGAATREVVAADYLTVYWQAEMLAALDRVRSAPYPAATEQLQSAAGLLIAALNGAEGVVLRCAIELAYQDLRHRTKKARTDLTWAEAWGGRKIYALQLYPAAALAKCLGITAQTLYRKQRLWSAKTA